jgi:hypothetical protein
MPNLFVKVSPPSYSTEADYRVIEWEKCGLLAESFIRLVKQATVEKLYIVRKLGTLPVTELENVSPS